MISKVIIKSFKRFPEDGQTFDDLARFQLIVGQNNSGKSTLLHALAIWQYCIDECRAASRKGETGIQVSLSNFTPLPLPDFRLLWNDKTERRYPKDEQGKSKQEYIVIEIAVTWKARDGAEKNFAIQLGYRSKETVSVIPVGGWSQFYEMDGGRGKERDSAKSVFPAIVYVPPTSNIDDHELYLNEGRIRALVGKGQPGSVVRNLILKTALNNKDGRKRFDELNKYISEWFGVEVLRPEDRSKIDQYIEANYRTKGGIELDWVNAGSGLLQTLIVLSFLYGYAPDVLLLDEPDAHLHVNLQRTLLNFLLKRQTHVQMLIATHAEELIRGVKPQQITFLTPTGSRRVTDTEQPQIALAEISNLDISNLIARKLIIYVEGETDEECMRGWAEALADDASFTALRESMKGVAFVHLSGGSAKEMLEKADRHFAGCKLLSESAQRLMVLDRNDGKWQARRAQDSSLFVWSKRHIESYLLVPSAWKRAAQLAAEQNFELATPALMNAVDTFFKEQSGGAEINWLNPTQQAFQGIDAKKMLFEARQSADDYNALASRLYDTPMGDAPVLVGRRDVAAAMKPEEIHDDVKAVFHAILDRVASIS
jgi:predicted ATPase